MSWLGCLLAVGSPSTAGSEAHGLEWWRLFLLGLVILCLFAVWWYVNRGKFTFKDLLKLPDSKIKVEEQCWINSRICVVLVRVGHERFLLAQNQTALSWQKLSFPTTQPEECLSVKGTKDL